MDIRWKDMLQGQDYQQKAVTEPDCMPRVLRTGQTEASMRYCSYKNVIVVVVVVVPRGAV